MERLWRAYKSFIEEENIGAIPLLPGTDGTKVLYEFLDYVLKHQDAHAHLNAVIPTRGTTMVVGKGFAVKATPSILEGEFASRFHNLCCCDSTCSARSTRLILSW